MLPPKMRRKKAKVAAVFHAQYGGQTAAAYGSPNFGYYGAQNRYEYDTVIILFPVSLCCSHASMTSSSVCVLLLYNIDHLNILYLPFEFRSSIRNTR